MENIFYHGTDSEIKALGIMESGILPDLSESEGIAKPVEGRVYLAKHLKDALPYLLGGAMCGHDLPNSMIEKSRYGFLFVIHKDSLEDIQPDEDQVGQAIHDQKFNWINKYKHYLQEEAIFETEEDSDVFLYNNLWEQLMSGEYIAWIKAGHLLLPKLSAEEKMDIIKHYGNIAHLGKVIPIECWKFDKLKSKELVEDGSNFFELAIKI